MGGPAFAATSNAPLLRNREPQEDEEKVLTPWNKEQAELLRRIALAGGSCAAGECQGTSLDALIGAGFVTVQAGNRVALTDAGFARARELRFGRPRHR
jgi:hypothetical protein